MLDREFDFQGYYAESYFQGGVDDGYADYIGSEIALRTEFQNVLAYLLKKTHGRASLLEFGCAYGFFLQEAARHFTEVEGIELSADAARYCQALGLKVAAGAVDDTTLRGPYDVAVGLDVIEHVPDPQDTVRLIAARLKPGGSLLLSTGDWGSLLARLMGKWWRLMTPPQHLSFFTRASMTLMIENTGLQLVELSHPWKRVPLALLAFQLQRMAGMKPRKLSSLSSLGIPINLWDSMRVLAVKPPNRS